MVNPLTTENMSNSPDTAMSSGTPPDRRMAKTRSLNRSEFGPSGMRLTETRTMSRWLRIEMARTYLAWGQARRRNRRKNAARDPLHQARDIFTRLQAQPWIERTEQELAACGERRPATTTAPLARLTPREVDVVLHAAHDATNAEIAAQLYLSRRTVEYHLANAYQKLGIASRRELAALLANAGHDSDPPGTPR